MKIGKTSATVIAASVNSLTGDSIYTLRVKFPRIILAEYNTHKLLSRNFSSSRAVPLATMRTRVLEELYVPSWTEYRKGMVSNTRVSDEANDRATETLYAHLLGAINFHETLELLGISKQDANRYLEPWMFVEGITTFTDYKNLLHLRNHDDAQPAFHELAAAMETAIYDATLESLEPGQWHIPMVTLEDRQTLKLADLLKVSTARCARTSYYLSGSSKVSSVDDDMDLFYKLRSSGHFSPFEHPAIALPGSFMSANFTGWASLRKFIPEESGGDVNATKILTPEETRNLMSSYLVGLDLVS